MVGVKHAFTNPKADGPDATITRPSDWNADHVITDLSVAGLFALTADEAITLSANTDNQAVAAGTTVIRITATTSPRNLTGLTGGADGRNLLLVNVGAIDVLLIHDATSTAANRFFLPNATTFALPPNSGVHLVYDSTLSRWRVLSQLNLASTTPASVGTAAIGTGLTAARGDHVHASGAGTPSTQAFGDSATTGSGPAAAMTDHKHAMPADPVTSHVAAGDPHTGYRLESADHTHATTGAQAGTIDHGALTGMGDDDHPQYVLESLYDAKGDLISASADNTPSKVTAGANDTILMADSTQTAGLKWVASQTPSTQASGDSALEGSADTYARGDHKHAFPVLIFSADFSKGGTLAVGAGTFRWYNRSGRTLTFDSVTASVGTAPTGATIIIDVNKGGTTIYSTQGNRPTIATSTNTIDDTTAPNTTTISDNEYLTIDIDQVGSTIAGADLTVQVWMRG